MFNFLHFSCLTESPFVFYLKDPGADPEILEREGGRGGGVGDALYVGNHGWLVKKILSFRWPEKAKIMLETISLWQNISISIFKFSSFLLIKSHQFFKIY